MALNKKNRNITALHKSARQCLRDFSMRVENSKWSMRFSKVLIKIENWHSDKCDLVWKLKETRFSRTYFQLHPKRFGKTNQEIGLLPTPTTGSNRNSRNAVLRIGEGHSKHGAALDLSQAVEISLGILSQEFDEWGQVPIFYKRLLPTPIARDYRNPRHPDVLQAKGRTPSNSLGDTISSITGKSTKLNPMFIFEMMGFPAKWTLLPYLKYKANNLKSSAIKKTAHEN